MGLGCGPAKEIKGFAAFGAKRLKFLARDQTCAANLQKRRLFAECRKSPGKRPRWLAEEQS